MPVLKTAREFAQWHFKCEEPTPVQMNSVTQQCRDGTIRNAEKVGREWVINCTAEWPRLFPEEEARPEADPASALGELLIAVGTMLKEGVPNGRERSDAA